MASRPSDVNFSPASSDIVAALQTMAEIRGSSLEDTRALSFSAKRLTLARLPRSRVSIKTLELECSEINCMSLAVLGSFSGDGLRTVAINVC